MNANQTMQAFRAALQDRDRDGVKRHGEALVRMALNGVGVPDGFASAGRLLPYVDTLMAPMTIGFAVARPIRNSARHTVDTVGSVVLQ